MRTSSVAAVVVRRGIALVAVVAAGIGVASVGTAPASASPATCRGDHITVAQLSSGCAASSGTVVLADGRRFAVPPVGTTVSALPVGQTGADDGGDVSITNTGRTGLAVRVDHAWSGAPRAVQQERAAVQHRAAVTSTDAASTSLQGSGLHGTASGATATTKSPTSSCTNATYTKLGYRWKAPVRWSYNPAGQVVAGSSAIRAGADAWTGPVAACNRKATSAADQQLLGTTTQAPGVTATGGCGAASGVSVVGWGALRAGTLAVTCVWSRAGVAVEVDQRYTTGQRWASTTACSGPRFDLRGVATHEWGHAFGLGHTAQSSGLVMKPASTTCEVAQRTLGLGDLAGIDALY